MARTNINAPGKSIECSLHLIDKNLFSIKQYQFPAIIGLNLFKESRCTSPLCVRRRLRLYIYPSRQQVMVRRDRECAANEEETWLWPWQYHLSWMFSSAAAGVMNTVSVFRWLSGTGEEKMDPDKSVVFGYDEVLALVDLAIAAPCVHNLCFPTRHRWKGFKLSESDTRPTSRVRKFKDI